MAALEAMGRKPRSGAARYVAFVNTPWQQSLVAGVLVALSACATSEDAGSGVTYAGGNTPATTDNANATVGFAAACAQLAQARCSANERCTNNYYNISQYGLDGTAACVASLTAQCAQNQPLPDSVLAPADLQSCASAVTSETCAVRAGAGPALAACVPPAGKRALGHACFSDEQCASTHCATPGGVACGTCAAPPVYTAPVPASPCNNAACPYQNVCVGPAGKQQCAPLGTTAGVACDPNGVTAADCDYATGLVCDPMILQCTQPVRAALGQPCAHLRPDVANVACAGAAVCIHTTGGSTGTCIALVAVGQPCYVQAGSFTGPACAPPGVCVANPAGSSMGVCTVVTPAMCPN